MSISELYFRIFWVVVLLVSCIACFFFTSKLVNRYNHPIAIALAQPKSVETVPFPAVTFMEPFHLDQVFMHDDFYYAKFIHEDRPVLFKFLEDNNLIHMFFTKIYVCTWTSYFFEYPFEDYQRFIVPILKNISLERTFEQQEASWNSQFKAAFAKRLTSRGFGYSFNILDADEILNVDE